MYLQCQKVLQRAFPLSLQHDSFRSRPQVNRGDFLEGPNSVRWRTGDLGPGPKSIVDEDPDELCGGCSFWRGDGLLAAVR